MNLLDMNHKVDNYQEVHVESIMDDKKNILKGKHILVTEDNVTNQVLARAMLEKSGITVTIAEDGEIAVEALQNQTFDAVLMDIQMPKMDGFEATKQIFNGSH